MDGAGSGSRILDGDVDVIGVQIQRLGIPDTLGQGDDRLGVVPDKDVEAGVLPRLEIDLMFLQIRITVVYDAPDRPVLFATLWMVVR